MSKSAARMSLHRERRKRGLKCVTLEIRTTEISALVKRGLLADADKASTTALRDALHGHLGKTLTGAA